jgi:hypothetical protein
MTSNDIVNVAFIILMIPIVICIWVNCIIELYTLFKRWMNNR